MKFPLTFILLLAVFGYCAGQTSAQDSLPANSNQLFEVLVTARRAPAKRFDTPASLSVISRNDRQLATARSTPEAIWHAPGVFVQKTNHGGGSPFVRGLTGNQTLLMIDGIRLSNATFRFGPNQYFNTLDPFSLQRIEVLRGAGSVAYGTDALGGVIQAISRTPDFKDQASWQGSVSGRFATQDQDYSGRAELQFGKQNLAFLGGVTRRDFGDVVGGKNTGTQSPSGYQEYDFDGKLRWALNPATIFTLAHQNVTQTHVPVYHKVQLENFAENAMNPQRRQLTYLRVEHSRTNKKLEHLEATFSLHQTEEGRTALKNASTALRNENDRVRSLGVHLQGRTRFTTNWSAIHGLEGYADFVGSNRYDINTETGISTAKRGLYPDRSELFSLALYSLHRYEFRQWQAELGARLNTFSIRIPDKDLGNISVKPEALVWNASLLRHLGQTVVYLSYNTAFRAPNIDDLGTLGIVDFRYEIPNFDLKPERTGNLELGTRWQSRQSQLELAVFQSRIQDFIVRTLVPGDSISGYPVYTKENAGKSVIYGAEWAASQQFGRNWKAEGSLTYTYGENESANEPMRRIPPVFGRLALKYMLKSWRVEAEWLAAGKQTRLAAGDKSDNRIPAGGTPGWNTFNFHAAWIGKRLEIQASGVNLFNQDYRTHGSGINGAGRSLWIQASWRFGGL